MLLTIGAFGYTADEFVAALHQAGVDAVVDVRLRRGMRGRDYSWANVGRLEARLETEGIGYLALKNLAPTKEVRAIQHAVDAAARAAKRRRAGLSPEFTEAYEGAILGSLDPADTAAQIRAAGSAPALFCVEATPAACHRGLIAEWLVREGAVTSVTHLGR